MAADHSHARTGPRDPPQTRSRLRRRRTRRQTSLSRFSGGRGAGDRESERCFTVCPPSMKSSASSPILIRLHLHKTRVGASKKAASSYLVAPSCRSLGAFFLPLLLLPLCHVEAYTCPNKCSGHGSCADPTSTGSSAAGTLSSTMGLCNCDTGWTLPDCSGRTCPTAER